MNFRQLRTFILTAESGGFARAAATLHLSQPAASRQISALETELGVSLFDRLGRRLQLTSDGEDLLRRGRHLLHEVDLFRDRAKALKGGETGTLRVGGTPQSIETVLAPFLPQFRRRHPRVDVHFLEDGGSSIGDRLERGDAQLGLTIPGNELLAGRLLYPIFLLAVLPRSHKLARRSSIDVAELADEPLLLVQRSYASRGWFNAACHNADFTPNVVLESGAPHTLMALAATGAGIAIVPSNVRVLGSNIRAIPVLQKGGSIGKWAIVAWDRRRFLPSFALNFVEELAAFVRSDYPGREVTKRAPRLPRPKGF
jgi:LysR family transcriptional regulator, cyn operon transcriptional activator